MSWRLMVLGGLAASVGIAMASCGGDSSPPDGGSSSGGGPSSSGGAPSGDGGSSTGGGPDGEAGAPGAGFACANTPVPNENITDFVIFSSGNWGVDSSSLTGGSFTYNGESSTISTAHSEGELQITASVVNYVGFGLWFGPCSDASEFTGIEFTARGDIGGEFAELAFQVQTSRNYPIETDKGECEGTFSSGCSFNTRNDVELGSTSTTVQVSWAELTGGQPISTLDPTEILGIQWQFNCDSAAEEPCAVDVVLEDVRFY